MKLFFENNQHFFTKFSTLGCLVLEAHLMLNIQWVLLVLFVIDILQFWVLFLKNFHNASTLQALQNGNELSDVCWGDLDINSM